MSLHLGSTTGMLPLMRITRNRCLCQRICRVYINQITPWKRAPKHILQPDLTTASLYRSGSKAPAEVRRCPANCRCMNSSRVCDFPKRFMLCDSFGVISGGRACQQHGCSNETMKKKTSFSGAGCTFRGAADTRPPDITIYNLDDDTNKSLEHKLGLAQKPVLRDRAPQGNGTRICRKNIIIPDGNNHRAD